MMRILAKVAIAFVAACSTAQVESAEQSHRDVEVQGRIKRIELGLEVVPGADASQPPLRLNLRQMMDLNADPGLSVAVIDHYRIAWVKAYGMTGPREEVPVTTKTLFQAGSISKPVAAAGMLALVERGKLSLDADVNGVLRSWKVPENEYTKSEKVTLRRLASHTAGLTVHGFPGYDIDAALPTVVQILDGAPPANSPPIRVDFVPGTRSRYSGGGVTIEQQVMVDVTRRDFPGLMNDLVRTKVGMKDSTYAQPLPADLAARAATGTYADGKAVHGKWHVYPEMAAAGLWTTPTDLAKFAIETALSAQGKSNKVLAQKTTREMLTAQPGTEGAGGLGFFVGKFEGEFEHSGADEGFQALLRMDAATGQGAVVMANSDNGILVGLEFMHSVAKEYGWKNMPPDRSIARQLVLVAKLRGIDAALSMYDMLLKVDSRQPPDEHVLAMLGDRLLQAGKVSEAIVALKRNAVQFPHSVQAFTNVGQAYASAGMAEDAGRSFREALKIDPDNQDAKEALNKLTGTKPDQLPAHR